MHSILFIPPLRTMVTKSQVSWLVIQFHTQILKNSELHYVYDNWFVSDVKQHNMAECRLVLFNS